MAINRGYVIVELRMAWWVKPYLLAMKTILRVVAPFLNVATGDKFASRQALFIAEHGIVVSEKRQRAD